MPTFQKGNTVRLEVTFNDFDNTPTNPDAGTTKLTLYGASLDDELLSIPESGLTKDVGDGQFSYPLVLTWVGEATYEWYGEIAGRPAVARRVLSVAEV